MLPNATAFLTSRAVLVDTAFIWSWPILISVIALCGLGNCLILYKICSAEGPIRPVDYLLVNLCINSFLMLAAVVSESLQKQLPLLSYGRWSCRMYPVHMSTIPAEGFTLMRMCLDRARIVQRPHDRQSRGVVVSEILRIWLASLGLNLIQGILFWDYDEETGDFRKCSDKNQSGNGGPYPYLFFLIFYFTAVFMLPCLIMLNDLFHLASQLRFLRTCQVIIQNMGSIVNLLGLGRYTGIWKFGILLQCGRGDQNQGLRARRERLIRNAIIFTALSILLKLPSGAHYTIYRAPRGVLPETVHDWCWEWRRFFFGTVVLHASFYPSFVFWLSREIRNYFTCCSVCASEMGGGAGT